MKSRSTYFYIILITWGSVNCEQNYADDEGTGVDFARNIEYTELVDPHSFDYDRANKKMRDRQAVRFTRSDDICITDGKCRRELQRCRDALDNIEFNRLYTTRLINLLLSSAKLQEENDRLTGSITFSGTKAQIEELRRFEDGKITMQQLDAILSEIITPTTNILVDTFFLIDSLRLTIYQHSKMFTAALTTLLALLCIKFVNWSTRKVVTVFLAGVFFISFFMVWSRLIKEAELKHLVTAIKYKKPPIQCDPEKMYLWDRFLTIFEGNDKCLEYYKAIEFDAFHEVTAFDALFELLDIGSRVGTLINRFVEHSTETLPYVLKWPITVLLYMSIVLIFAVSILALCGIRISLWVPLCGLSIGGGNASREQRQPSLIEQRQPSLTEQRTPIIHITTGIVERNANGELRQLLPITVTQTTDGDYSAIGAGDSRIQNQEAISENSEIISSTCCCKSSLNKSHVEEDEDAVNKPTESEDRSKEKGDGDC